MSEQKVVMRESDEAAHFGTVTGWISRQGHFYGNDESTARYAGCTHQLCRKCEKEVITQHESYCRGCRHLQDIERFEKLDKVLWDGETPLCLDDDDRFFFTDSDLMDYCFDEGIQPQELRLRICEPQYGRYVDTDYFCDELAEDGEIPDGIMAAMEVMNKAIKEAGPLSWWAGDKAAVIPDHYKVCAPSTDVMTKS